MGSQYFSYPTSDERAQVLIELGALGDAPPPYEDYSRVEFHASESDISLLSSGRRDDLPEYEPRITHRKFFLSFFNFFLIHYFLFAFFLEHYDVTILNGSFLPASMNYPFVVVALGILIGINHGNHLNYVHQHAFTASMVLNHIVFHLIIVLYPIGHVVVSLSHHVASFVVGFCYGHVFSSTQGVCAYFQSSGSQSRIKAFALFGLLRMMAIVACGFAYEFKQNYISKYNKHPVSDNVNGTYHAQTLLLYGIGADTTQYIIANVTTTKFPFDHNYKSCMFSDSMILLMVLITVYGMYLLPWQPSLTSPPNEPEADEFRVSYNFPEYCVCFLHFLSTSAIVFGIVSYMPYVFMLTSGQSYDEYSQNIFPVCFLVTIFVYLVYFFCPRAIGFISINMHYTVVISLGLYMLFYFNTDNVYVCMLICAVLIDSALFTTYIWYQTVSGYHPMCAADHFLSGLSYGIIIGPAGFTYILGIHHILRYLILLVFGFMLLTLNYLRDYMNCVLRYGDCVRVRPVPLVNDNGNGDLFC